ncbi:MAG: hypothetical protein HYR56_08055 [Acidobacteria bacterium]|nr:hypothetical protein [Acidobacteriota bacterium]MBI3422758.1 hypothetical protein [Acidobacteriota bacterium]
MPKLIKDVVAGAGAPPQDSRACNAEAAGTVTGDPKLVEDVVTGADAPPQDLRACNAEAAGAFAHSFKLELKTSVSETAGADVPPQDICTCAAEATDSDCGSELKLWAAVERCAACRGAPAVITASTAAQLICAANLL